MSGASGTGLRRISVDRESFVASLSALPAFCQVCRQATGEGQHLARLAGIVRAEIPGAGAREEGCARQFEHLRSPRFFRGARSLDPRVIALARVVPQVTEAIAMR